MNRARTILIAPSFVCTVVSLSFSLFSFSASISFPLIYLCPINPILASHSLRCSLSSFSAIPIVVPHFDQSIPVRTLPSRRSICASSHPIPSIHQYSSFKQTCDLSFIKQQSTSVRSSFSRVHQLWALCSREESGSFPLAATHLYAYFQLEFSKMSSFSVFVFSEINHLNQFDCSHFHLPTFH